MFRDEVASSPVPYVQNKAVHCLSQAIRHVLSNPDHFRNGDACSRRYHLLHSSPEDGSSLPRCAIISLLERASQQTAVRAFKSFTAISSASGIGEYEKPSAMGMRNMNSPRSFSVLKRRPCASNTVISGAAISGAQNSIACAFRRRIPLQNKLGKLESEIVTFQFPLIFPT